MYLFRHLLYHLKQKLETKKKLTEELRQQSFLPPAPWGFPRLQPLGCQPCQAQTPNKVLEVFFFKKKYWSLLAIILPPNTHTHTHVFVVQTAWQPLIPSSLTLNAAANRDLKKKNLYDCICNQMACTPHPRSFVFPAVSQAAPSAACVQTLPQPGQSSPLTDWEAEGETKEKLVSALQW